MAAHTQQYAAQEMAFYHDMAMQVRGWLLRAKCVKYSTGCTTRTAVKWTVACMAALARLPFFSVASVLCIRSVIQKWN